MGGEGKENSLPISMGSSIFYTPLAHASDGGLGVDLQVPMMDTVCVSVLRSRAPHSMVTTTALASLGISALPDSPRDAPSPPPYSRPATTPPMPCRFGLVEPPALSSHCTHLPLSLAPHHGPLTWNLYDRAVSSLP